MLHPTRENCDSKVILPNFVVEEFVGLGEDAIFFWTIGSRIFRDWRPGLLATLTQISEKRWRLYISLQYLANQTKPTKTKEDPGYGLR